MMAFDESQLIGRWVHAFEEDEAGVRVFRRAGAQLPPARGRAALEIGPGLVALQSAPGPDDRPRVGATVQLKLSSDARSGGDILRILHASPDRLVIAKD